MCACLCISMRTNHDSQNTASPTFMNAFLGVARYEKNSVYFRLNLGSFCIEGKYYSVLSTSASVRGVFPLNICSAVNVGVKIIK